MLVFEVVTTPTKCSIISGFTGRTLYKHKQSEVNTNHTNLAQRLLQII